MDRFTGIGLMSGTSLDGLDLVACTFELSGESYAWSLIAADQVPFDEKWESRLAHLHEQSAEIYAKTHVYFGHWLGQQVLDFIQRFGLKPDFVASHGQTIFHQPERNFTAQIGDGETLASYLPCPLVCNFRNKDVALGGEGAPLVPLGEQMLFPGYSGYLNLGGFANLTVGSMAFDVCPCNMVLNPLAAAWNPDYAYDPEGQVAAVGTLRDDLFQALNGLPFYAQLPPKSLGREFVEAEIIPVLATHTYPVPDLLHTYVHHVAHQLGQALDKVAVPEGPFLVTGGSAHNRFLMHLIQEVLDQRGLHLAAPEQPEWIGYKEAIIFAFLGLRVLTGHTSTLASVTGARTDAVCGAIHLPVNGQGLAPFLPYPNHKPI